MNATTFPENLDRPGLEQRQLDRLQSLLETVVTGSRFWATRLRDHRSADGRVTLKSLDELARLPLTGKSDLVADQQTEPPYGTLPTWSRDAYSRLHQTSGTTTGVPMRWLDTPASWSWFLDCWAQIFRMAGLRPDDRLLFPFSFGPFVGFWAAFEGANRLGNLCLAAGGMTSQQRLRMLFDNEATVVCCTPTYALRLAEVAAEQNIDLAGSSVRMLIVAGEPGGSIPAIRQRIEAAWGARVIDHWGMTEIGALAAECLEQPGGLHVLESECIVEIIDPGTLQPVEPDANGVRRGELVLTNLGRAGSALLRYRTGDLVETDPALCPCGRHLVRLRGGILGRADDMLTIRGNNVFPSSVEAVLREFNDVAEFRIEVRTERAMHHMQIQIEPVRNLTAEQTATLLTQVRRAIRDRLNFHAEIVSVPPDTLPRFELKGRRFFRITEE